MKFLIIGSNSFSGASFVRHLLRAGHDVIGISRSAEPNAAYLPYRWDTATKVPLSFINWISTVTCTSFATSSTIAGPSVW